MDREHKFSGDPIEVDEQRMERDADEAAEGKGRVHRKVPERRNHFHDDRQKVPWQKKEKVDPPRQNCLKKKKRK